MMKRFNRIWLVGLAVVVVLGGLFVAAKKYLGSQQLAPQVAARLQAAYGGPVRVGEVDVGVNRSSLRHLRLYEAGAGPSDEPWVDVDTVEADVSLWGLLRGQAMPRSLTFTGARLTVRLDSQGHLATRLPQFKKSKAETLPVIHLRQGDLTIHQDGRPPMELKGIDGRLEQQGDRLALSGKVTDPYWGDWAVEGSLNGGHDAGSATLKTGMVHVTQDMLDRLPLVPRSVWEEVQITEGETPVEFAFRFGPDARDTHYRVTMRPQHTTVHVTAVGLTATDAQGGLVLDDKIVRLRDVTGGAAGGAIKTTGDLDFGTPTRLRFQVHADRLDVRRLPAS
jgi:uncharacterized protein YhdP